MKTLPCLELHTAQQWRAWLRKNHKSSEGVWLVYFKPHTGEKTIAYEDSVREALCFGWIDSLIKRIDDDRYARKFTPRTANSAWSESNRKRWSELKAAGLLQRAGLEAAPSQRKAEAPPMPQRVAPYIIKAIKAVPKAWKTFQSLSMRDQLRYALWIDIAKRPETRKKRIRESIKMLAQGKSLGLK